MICEILTISWHLYIFLNIGPQIIASDPGYTRIYNKYAVTLSFCSCGISYLQIEGFFCKLRKIACSLYQKTLFNDGSWIYNVTIRNQCRLYWLNPFCYVTRWRSAYVEQERRASEFREHLKVLKTLICTDKQENINDVESVSFTLSGNSAWHLCCAGSVTGVVKECWVHLLQWVSRKDSRCIELLLGAKWTLLYPLIPFYFNRVSRYWVCSEIGVHSVEPCAWETRMRGIPIMSFTCQHI